MIYRGKDLAKTSIFTSTTAIIYATTTEWRDKARGKEHSVKDLTGLAKGIGTHLAAEAIYALLTPLAAIELVARAALAILFTALYAGCPQFTQIEKLRDFFRDKQLHSLSGVNIGIRVTVYSLCNVLYNIFSKNLMNRTSIYTPYDKSYCSPFDTYRLADDALKKWK